MVFTTMSNTFLCSNCQRRMLKASFRTPTPLLQQTRWSHSRSDQPSLHSDTLGIVNTAPQVPRTIPLDPTKLAERRNRASKVDPRLQTLFKSVINTTLSMDEDLARNQSLDPSERLRDDSPRMSTGITLNTPIWKRASRQGFRFGLPNHQTLVESWEIFKVDHRGKQVPKIRLTGPHDSTENDFTVNSFKGFLTAFARFNDFDKMLDVWNALLASTDLVPLTMWALVLRGVAKSRDWKTHERIWQQMTESGIEANEAMWICKLKLLVRLRQWRLAVQCLSTFLVSPAETTYNPFSSGRDHDHHPAHTSNGALDSKLPINLVNVLLQELLYLGYNEDVREVYKWAESSGCKINTITINLFIKAAAENETLDEARRGLHLIRQRYLEPDPATISILLSALVRQRRLSSPEASPKAQRRGVLAILKELEASGLGINKYTYSILISSLLKENANIEAVGLVLEHMQSRHIEPSLEMYTTLALFYFSQEPVDFAGLDELWQVMRLRGQAPDRDFCDRMIRGYATAGKIEKMMFFLQISDQSGFLPRWDDLTAALEALAKANEVEILSQVIKDARDHRGIFRRDGLRGNWAEAALFWTRIKELEERGLGGRFSVN